MSSSKTYMAASGRSSAYSMDLTDVLLYKSQRFLRVRPHLSAGVLPAFVSVAQARGITVISFSSSLVLKQKAVIFSCIFFDPSDPGQFRRRFFMEVIKQNGPVTDV